MALIIQFALVAISITRINGYQHDKIIGTDLDQSQGLASSLPEAYLGYMMNHLNDHSSDIDQNSLRDHYQSNNTLDQLNLLNEDTIRSHYRTVNFPLEDNNDILNAIVNLGKGSRDMVSDAQNDNLDDVKRMLNTLMLDNDNNAAEDSYQKDASSNNDLDQTGTDNIPELLEHLPILSGHQYVQGGSGEGRQLLGPNGSFENVQVIKTDTALPSYCDPPNPCPIGYTSNDGCIEDFENTATFSREYQASQDCTCDSEHSLFDCPTQSGNKADAGENNQEIEQDNNINTDSQLTTLARSIQNRLEDVNLGDLENKLNRLYNSKLNNNYDSNIENPYLIGDKLPIVAKKAPKIEENHL